MIQKLTENLNIISGLNSRPNLRDGLTDGELKAKFDEAANILKEYINTVLIPDIEAKNIPFQSSSGNVNGETVVEALEWLKEQIENVQVGQIVDSSIGLEKLTDAVKSVLNSGIPYVGETAPNSADLPVGQLWLKTEGGKIVSMNILLSDNTWLSYAEPVLPVRKGGTGVDNVSRGAILCGGNDAMEKIVMPDEPSFLGVGGNAPEWQGKEKIKEVLGFLNVAEGEYTGNKDSKEVSLMDGEKEITPKLLYVFRKNGAKDLAASEGNNIEDAIVLAQGAEIMRYVQIRSKVNHMTVSLVGNKIVFANKNVSGGNALFMNEDGTEYRWVALY